MSALPRALMTVAVPAAVLSIAALAGALSTGGALHPVLALGAPGAIGALALSWFLVARTARSRLLHLERKVRERTAGLELALEQLHEASRRQEQFVAHLSHELFTPLTTIVGTMSVLSDPSAVDAEQIPALVEMAARSSEHLTQRIEELMVATGITGVVGVERAPFDAAAEIREVLKEFEPLDKAVLTKFDHRTHAVGDPGRFRAAMRHLLANADKFGPQGSVIRVETRADIDRVVFVVHDEGPGIPQEHHEAVFERFSRPNGQAGSRSHEGLGLGLFASRQVMRAMGGDVVIDDIARGCAVRVALPAAEHRATLPRKTVTAAALACLLFVSGAALAASGNLPAPVQDALAGIADTVGVDLPRADGDAGPADGEVRESRGDTADVSDDDRSRRRTRSADGPVSTDSETDDQRADEHAPPETPVRRGPVDLGSPDDPGVDETPVQRGPLDGFPGGPGDPRDDSGVGADPGTGPPTDDRGGDPPPDDGDQDPEDGGGDPGNSPEDGPPGR